MPSASPRRSGGNQCRTARPLADCTLAPLSPASAISTKSAQKLRVCEAARRAAPQHAEPAHEHDALAEAIGRETPRDQADHRPAERAREEQPGLAEREVELVAQKRRHDRDAVPDRRVGGLRKGAGREDRPAVATLAGYAHAARRSRTRTCSVSSLRKRAGSPPT